MSEQQRLYIAGMGMITPVGANTAMTAAAVKAGISGYKVSDFYGDNGEPITMASVPNLIFEISEADIDEGSRYNERHDRVTRMAIIAMREACAEHATEQPIPLVLAMREEQSDSKGLSPLILNLENNCKPWVSSKHSRSIYSGRAAGMEAIDFAFHYLYDLPNDFMMIGGSDSYQDYSLITPLSKADRLLATNSADAFAPGEAAGFLLLTRRPELAMVRDGQMIALHPPGISDETGHLGNEEPYRGEGLDQAFKKALNGHTHPAIHSIYSSMNGENHWAKEYGVASIRNKAAFIDTVSVEHPADIMGDVGSATSPVLIALAAENLYSHPKAKTHLVYSSSDTAKRGALVLEKLPAIGKRT